MTDYGELLTGERVRVWPYAKGLYPESILAHMWSMINDAGAAHKVFWAHNRNEKLDTVNLGFFLSYMSQCLPLLVQDLESQEMIGMVWLDEIIMGHRSNINMFYRRKAWGSKAKEASQICLRYSFEAFKFDTLWGMTPWREARNHAVKAGFKHVATLDRYACILGEYRSVYVIQKENYDNDA